MTSIAKVPHEEIEISLDVLFRIIGEKVAIIHQLEQQIKGLTSAGTTLAAQLIEANKVIEELKKNG